MSHAMDRPLVLPWWRRKPWAQLVAAAVLAIVGVATLMLFAGTSERTIRMPMANVTIATATRGAFHDVVPLNGTIQALDTIYVDAQEGGVVEHVLAQPGDFVTQGQPLVELSNTGLELDVLEREARIIESITELQSYETQLQQNQVANGKALAQIQYDIVRMRRSRARLRVLVAQALEPVSAQDSVQDELDYDLRILPMQQASNAKQEMLRLRQLPEIQSQLVKLGQDLKITHGTLDDLTVRAPVSGRVISIQPKPGQSSKQGDELAEVNPDSRYKVSANVDEYYLGRVRVGQMAEVDLSNETFRASVTRVYPQVQDGTFEVDLRFQGHQPTNLIPGETVQGHLSLSADRLALTLPAGAFLERTAGRWAFVLGPDGRIARRRPITLGRRTADQVEVLGGLSAGDRVIVSDYTGLDQIDRIELEH